MATLKDVAKVAGVAPITVSRVVNDPENVKEATRLRVQAVMKELRYVPNLAARSLAANRVGVIDVYIPEHLSLSNPFVMYLIAGISDTLSRKMYSFLILRDRSREHLCDGYIVTGLVRNEIREFAAYAAERDRPVVLFGHTESDGIDCVDVDNVQGSGMAVEHLIHLGHREIAMINVAEDKDYTDDRLDGYRTALEVAGIPYDESKVIYVPNSSEGGAQAVHRLMDQTKFTAIFCATDTIGVGAAAELGRLGLSVPEDVSLMGFDGLGHNLLAAPTLTSIEQPVYEIGMILAKTLLDKLDGKKTQHNRLVMPKFLPGHSAVAPGGRVVRNSVTEKSGG